MRTDTRAPAELGAELPAHSGKLTVSSVQAPVGAGSPNAMPSSQARCTSASVMTFRATDMRFAAATTSAFRAAGVAGQTWAPGFAAVIWLSADTQDGSVKVVIPIHRASTAATRAPSRAA